MAEEKEKKARVGLAKTAAVGMGVAAFVSILTWFGILQKNEYFVTDLRYVHRPPVNVDTSIITIDIDDNAVDQIGRWPWTWDRHAAVVDFMRLYGARSLSMVEPYFSEPGPITIQREQAIQIARGVSQMAQPSPAGEERADLESLIPDFNLKLDRAIARFPNTFVGNSFAIPEGERAKDFNRIRDLTAEYKKNFSQAKKDAIASLDTLSISMSNPGSVMLASDIIPVTRELSRNIRGAGFYRILQDGDGIVRRTPLLVWFDGRAHLNISLSMAAAHFECPLDQIKIQPGRHITIPGKNETVKIPIDRSGNMIINWVGGYQESFTHIPFNAVALHYAHQAAKRYIQQYRLGMDNPQEVMQKLGEYLMGLRLVPRDDVENITIQVWMVWIMDFFMDRGAPYEAFLQNTQQEHGETLRRWWDRLAVNKRTEEFLRAGQNADYSAVLFSLDLKDTDLYRDGYDRTVFFYGNGRVNEVRPLFFMEPSEIDMSGVQLHFSPKDFADRTVFVGLTATGLNAFNPTPHSGRFQMFGMLPNVYNTIVTQKFLRAQAPWFQYFYIIIYALMVTWLVLHFRPLLGFAVAILTTVLHVSMAWILFMGPGVIIPVVAPVIAVILCYVAGNLFRYWEEQKERQKVRGLFGAMVSPEVLKMMEERGMALGGEKHEASMFSSDVSGFTTISEGVTAQELADILNIYLTPMSNIIMTFDGYCDKYEGDAIKADFGVPIPDPNHAWKACLSALLQQEELSVIQRLLLIKYGVKITARMGVNTGVVAAGNMGSEKKMQYTVMGDAVTLAEELEPINKLYETWIAIGPLTNEKSADYIEVRHLDRALMGPAAHPTDIYELMGWKREKFLEHWGNRPVPPLVIEMYQKIIPEKILGYIYYWDNKKLPESPFYKDIRALFDSLAPHALGYIKHIDIAAVANLREEIADLEKVIRANDSLLAGAPADKVLMYELEDYKQNRAKAKEPWQHILWDWKIQLKSGQNDVMNLFTKIPTADFDELLRRVDTYQKKTECYSKRCSFPAAGDTVGIELAENLKVLLVSEKPPMAGDAANAKAAEHLKAIRAAMDKFVLELPKRAKEYHEFIADHCIVPEYKFRVRDAFDTARKLYLKQDWDACDAAMKKIQEIDPKDGPAMKYQERTAHLRKHPPAKDWNGDWAEE